ncbi:MAG: hypothetical protein J6M90_08725 [Oscillospiraceae bacterium]|nr:hypothetical protein [Oscillospiraceae bacterium]
MPFFTGAVTVLQYRSKKLEARSKMSCQRIDSSFPLYVTKAELFADKRTTSINPRSYSLFTISYASEAGKENNNHHLHCQTAPLPTLHTQIPAAKELIKPPNFRC